MWDAREKDKDKRNDFYARTGIEPYTKCPSCGKALKEGE
jgi:hypothetical protein